ncbi:MAG: cytochrome d ubiquinol oxidase subunit II [Nitrospirota bacterium]
MDLNIIWFLLIGFFITVYVILDGYDFGVGLLHLFARDDQERRVNLSAIGPLWDGNEVWLIAGGGSLLAVFPVVYSTVLSVFYLLFFLLLFSLILRALSIEFRDKVTRPGWQRFWDWGFALGSILSSLMFGIMLGNVLQGLPINEGHISAGHLSSLINPYSVFTGILTLALCAMHGAIYMTLKADDVYLRRIKRYVFIAWIVFIILYPAVVAVTVYTLPVMIKTLLNKTLFIPLAIINIASIVYIPIANRQGKCGRAFSASAVMIASLMGLLGLSLFPALVPSSIDPLYSLTAYNASAGPYTLKVMLVIALIALPMIIGYAVFVNWVFKGKTVIHGEGYD